MQQIISIPEWSEIVKEIEQEDPEERARHLTSLHKLPFGECTGRKGRKRNGYRINPAFL